jgi:hypothetical protein
MTTQRLRISAIHPVAQALRGRTPARFAGIAGRAIIDLLSRQQWESHHIYQSVTCTAMLPVGATFAPSNVTAGGTTVSPQLGCCVAASTVAKQSVTSYK